MMYIYFFICNVFTFYVANWIGENKYRVKRKKLEEIRENNILGSQDYILNGSFKTFCIDCGQETTKILKHSLRNSKIKKIESKERKRK